MPLPSTVISSFFGTMSTRTSYYPFDFLSYSFDCTSYLIWGDNRTSAVPITYLSSTSPSSQTGGMPLYPCLIGYNSIVCCGIEYIDHFQPHTNFPAQSLHFRIGSVAPCPTLKPNVTISIPRTRYRRLARPYLIGFFSYCMIISLPELTEFLPLARGNQLCWFHSSHLLCSIT